MSSTLPRLIQNKVVASLQAFPAVYLAGSRQSGKTTLAKYIARSMHPAGYITFDDIQLLQAAKRDPQTFLRNLEGAWVLDEIQMVPELFRWLKILIDEQREAPEGGKGRFLLTGSASVLALPQLSDALVGRMALHSLFPFSLMETASEPASSFIDRAFAGEWRYETTESVDWIARMNQATYPEISGIENPSLQRDVRALQEVEKLTALPDLLRLIGSRPGFLLNDATLSRETGLNHITLKKYRTLLTSLYLVTEIPAWSANLGKRLIKSPKLYLSDLSLLMYLWNSSLEEVASSQPTMWGKVLENLVANELTKQMGFSTTPVQLYHYRSAAGQEVDFVLEGPHSSVVGIEVKATRTVTPSDFRHLDALKAALGEKWVKGVVLYSGEETIPFGKDQWAVPLSRLG
jgi:predicted AAA+ superfamily ATPase